MPHLREPTIARNESPASGDSSPASVRVLGFRGSDAELLQRLQSDRAAGAALLHDRFAKDVNGLVWRLLGADQDHDDIVQQVFCKLLLSAGSVRDPSKLRGWVQSVTVNAVYSELRKRGVRRLFMSRQLEQPRPYFDAMSHSESRDLLARLYRELDRMPAAERVAFSLRYIEEKPLVVVAELCECSLATIKRRLQRANKRFAALCSRYPELSERLERASAARGADDAEDSDMDAQGNPEGCDALADDAGDALAAEWGAEDGESNHE
jgi:RNA polymerase sigma-70 factor, ECF subfamily